MVSSNIWIVKLQWPTYSVLLQLWTQEWPAKPLNEFPDPTLRFVSNLNLFGWISFTRAPDAKGVFLHRGYIWDPGPSFRPLFNTQFSLYPMSTEFWGRQDTISPDFDQALYPLRYQRSKTLFSYGLRSRKLPCCPSKACNSYSNECKCKPKVIHPVRFSFQLSLFSL